jgi:hypothetical protein
MADLESISLQPANFYVLVMFIISEFVPTCARRIFDIVGALCLAVGNAIRPGFIQATMAMLVCRRIMRVRGLLLGLEARFLAGTLKSCPGRGAGRVVPAGLVASVDLGLPVVPRRVGCLPAGVPRRFAWLCVLVPGEAACFAGQLRVVLAEPGMAALLAACPQAVRIVRPLCWMLGIARADFVPGERVVVAAVDCAGDDNSVVACRPEPAVTDVENAARFAEAAPGWGWVRFIPG